MPFPRHSTVLHCRLHVDTMKRIEEKGDLFSFVDIVIARTRATAHSTSVPRRENPLSIRILQKNWIKKGKKKWLNELDYILAVRCTAKAETLQGNFLGRQFYLFLFFFKRRRNGNSSCYVTLHKWFKREGKELTDCQYNKLTVGDLRLEREKRRLNSRRGVRTRPSVWCPRVALALHSTLWNGLYYHQRI